MANNKNILFLCQVAGEVSLDIDSKIYLAVHNIKMWKILYISE